MQNHPHDSICGCSVDEVHQEMMPRFEKANEIGKYVADEAVAQLLNVIDTSAFPKESRPFVVFNTSGTTRSGIVEVEVELSRKTFREGLPSRLYQELQQQPKGSYQIIDSEGKNLTGKNQRRRSAFDYELPKDAFGFLL